MCGSVISDGLPGLVEPEIVGEKMMSPTEVISPP
jgi:hypothetical protein